MEKVIKINGMGCEHCIKSVKNALEGLKDIKIKNVIIGEAIVDIPTDYNLDLIMEALDDAGYEVESIQYSLEVF